MVGQRPVTAGLEGAGVAACGRIEAVDGAKERIGILSASPVVDVDWERSANRVVRLSRAENSSLLAMV